MGGGGGDSGYEARQQAVEDQKAEARRRLNALFGEGAPAEVDRNRYISTRTIDDAGRDVTPVPGATGLNGAIGPGSGGSGEGDAGYNSGSGPNGNYGGGAVPLTRQEQVFDQAGYDADLAFNNGITGNKAAREALYSKVRGDAFNAGKRGLDEQREKAARDLRFELFAKGLNGGSEDINQSALLGRTYDKGILDLGAKADSAATELRSNDERTRLNLLQGIDSGMDAGSVLSSAANSLANNSDAAAAEAQGTSIGDLFANAGLLNQRSQYSQGKAAGTDWWNSLTPSTTTPKVRSSSGTISQS